MIPKVVARNRVPVTAEFLENRLDRRRIRLEGRYACKLLKTAYSDAAKIICTGLSPHWRRNGDSCGLPLAAPSVKHAAVRIRRTAGTERNMTVGRLFPKPVSRALEPSPRHAGCNSAQLQSVSLRESSASAAADRRLLLDRSLRVIARWSCAPDCRGELSRLASREDFLARNTACPMTMKPRLNQWGH